MPASSTYSRPLKTRVSFFGDATATLPSRIVPPRQSAVGDQRSVAGRRVERRNAAAAGAQPFGERPLRNELHLQLAVEILPLELPVLADVRAGRSPDALVVEQHAEAPAVDAAVVRDRNQIGRALFEQRLDQVVRYAAEPKAADRDARRRCGMSATASAQET